MKFQPCYRMTSPKHPVHHLGMLDHRQHGKPTRGSDNRQAAIQKATSCHTQYKGAVGDSLPFLEDRLHIFAREDMQLGETCLIGLYFPYGKTVKPLNPDFLQLFRVSLRNY